MMATEKRLISPDAFWDNLDLAPSEWVKASTIKAILDETPTVDAVEVERGWWIELPGMEPDYKCSECGRSYAWWEPSEAHYCPNCGAKMDGDGNV